MLAPLVPVIPTNTQKCFLHMLRVWTCIMPLHTSWLSTLCDVVKVLLFYCISLCLLCSNVPLLNPPPYFPTPSSLSPLVQYHHSVSSGHTYSHIAQRNKKLHKEEENLKTKTKKQSRCDCYFSVKQTCHHYPDRFVWLREKTGGRFLFSNQVQ